MAIMGKTKLWTCIPALSMALIVALPAYADEDRIGFLGFAQLTGEHVESKDGIDFGADRVRLRGDYETGRFLAALQFELNANNLDDRAPGALPNLIADLFVRYRFDEHHEMRMGQFKTPLGLDFNRSGHSLDVTKRGMDAGLVLNRNLGVMLSGRKLAERFGYDIGLFNVAGRSSATAHTDAQDGEDNSWVGRLMYDHGPWHVETAYGVSENAGGPGTEDYGVFDIGASYRDGPWRLSLEWIEGTDVRGVTNRDERVWLAHAGYRVSERWELVVRHNDGESEVAGVDTNLRNTYLGATGQVFKQARAEGRLQVNYVIAGGDEASYTGVRGFRSDAIFVQFQWKVSR